jgi:filamentous hemagglutinin family protein
MKSPRYRLIQSKRRQNTHRSHDFNSIRRLFTFMSTMSALVWHASASAQGLADTLPSGADIANGVVSMQQANNHLQINQTSGQAIINWDSFSIGAQASVHVQQPDAQSTLLNRVVGHQLSEIYGSFSANGQVVLVNPNGIVVGPSGRITATSFTASTLGLTDQDFLNHRQQYQKLAPSAATAAPGIRIMPGAVIQTAQGGYLALLSPSIEQSGQLRSQGGDVIVAAAEQVHVNDDLSLPLSQRVSLCVSIQHASPSIHHSDRGDIQTQGGSVLLRAAEVIDAISGAKAHVTVAGQINTSADLAGDITVLASNGLIAITGSLIADSSMSNAATPARIQIGRDSEQLAHTTVVLNATLHAQHGHVETSGQQFFSQGNDVQAQQWLLDPVDITITQAPINGGTSSTSTSSTNTSSVYVDDIVNSLNQGTNVTISTNQANTAHLPAMGNITVDVEIKKTGNLASTLTLEANHHIQINENITSTQGALNVNALILGNGDITLNNQRLIDTRGGDVNFQILGVGDINMGTHSRIQTGTGDLFLGNLAAGRSGLTLNHISGLQARKIHLVGNYGNGILASGGDIQASDTLCITNVNSGHINISNNLSAAHSITVNNTGIAASLDLANQSILSGIISGNASFIKQGSGHLSLTANNTYRGGTHIRGGRLQIGQGDRNTHATLGLGGIQMSGKDSHLIFHTGHVNRITQTIEGTGTVTGYESLHFLAPVSVNATQSQDNTLTIRTQTNAQSVSEGNILFQGNPQASAGTAIANNSTVEATLVVTATNGIFINNAIDSATERLHVSMTAQGRPYDLDPSIMTNAQRESSRGIVLSGKANINTLGTLSLNGTTQASTQTGVWLSARENVDESGQLEGETGSVLNIKAHSVQIVGSQHHESQTDTAKGVILDATIESTQGDTLIRAPQSGITLTDRTRIDHSTQAGTITLHAGNGSTNSLAGIELQTSTHTAPHTQITQHSDEGITLRTDGLGNITAPKIDHLGAGTVVIAAGTELDESANLDQANVRTLEGYQLYNPNGRTQIYTGSTQHTGRLYFLDPDLQVLNFSPIGTHAQNAHSATHFGLPNAQAHPRDVFFRERVAFDRPLTPTPLTYEYGSASIHAAQSEGLSNAMKYQIALDECPTQTRVSNSAWLRVSTGELLRTSQFNLDQATWSGSGYLNAGQHAMTMTNDTYTFDPTTSTAHHIQVTPKAITSASIAAVDQYYSAALTPGAVTLGNDVLAQDHVFAAHDAQVQYESAAQLSTGGYVHAGNYYQSVAGGLVGEDAGNYTFTGIRTDHANYNIHKLPVTLDIELHIPQYEVKVGWTFAPNDILNIAHNGLSLDNEGGIDGILFKDLRLTGPDHTNYALVAYKYPYTTVYSPSEPKQITSSTTTGQPSTLAASDTLRGGSALDFARIATRSSSPRFAPLFPSSLTHYAMSSDIPHDNLNPTQIRTLIRRQPFSNGLFPAQRVRWSYDNQTSSALPESLQEAFYIDNSRYPYQALSVQ